MIDKKIGGWLILLGFQLIATILISIYMLTQYYDLFRSEDWIALKQLNNSVASALIISFYYEVIMYVLILLITSIVIIRFFNKSHHFKDYYAIYIVVLVILLIIEYLLASKLEADINTKINQIRSSILAYIFWGAIWITYLYKGRRPSQTFVN